MPPACPPADSYFAGTACSLPGAQCPGNPTYCDGVLFHDALECQPDGEGLRWHDVAATICRVDAGETPDAAGED
jgi:hypothetical protein